MITSWIHSETLFCLYFILWKKYILTSSWVHSSLPKKKPITYQWKPELCQKNKKLISFSQIAWKELEHVMYADFFDQITCCLVCGRKDWKLIHSCIDWACEWIFFFSDSFIFLPYNKQNPSLVIIWWELRILFHISYDVVQLTRENGELCSSSHWMHADLTIIHGKYSLFFFGFSSAFRSSSDDHLHNNHNFILTQTIPNHGKNHIVQNTKKHMGMTWSTYLPTYLWKKPVSLPNPNSPV